MNDEGIKWLLKKAKRKLDGYDYEGAIRECDRAIDINPNCTEAYNIRTMAKVSLEDYEVAEGRYEQAIKSYDQAIENDSNNAMLYNDRGILKVNLKRYDEANLDFGKAIEIDSKCKNAYSSRGNLKFDIERYEEAITDYTKVIELDPNCADAYLSRGAAKGKLKHYHYKEALADFEKAIELNPNPEEARIKYNLLWKKGARAKGIDPNIVAERAPKIKRSSSITEKGQRHYIPSFAKRLLINVAILIAMVVLIAVMI